MTNLLGKRARVSNRRWSQNTMSYHIRGEPWSGIIVAVGFDDMRWSLLLLKDDSSLEEVYGDIKAITIEEA